jgi:hypothetical protein
MRTTILLAVILIGTSAELKAADAPPAAPAASAPAASSVPPGVEDPQAYTALVARAVEAREKRRQAVDEMNKKLRELSQPGLDPKVADAAKRELLIRRRTADQEHVRARRAMELYWFERTLTPKQRAEFLELPLAEQEELLDSRSVTQRLAVPLPPGSFTAASVDTVLAYIEQEAEVRVVADWPALAETGMQRRSPVSLEIGRYNRPAIDTLRSVVELLSKGKAKIDLSWPDAAIITTDAGLKQYAELNRKVMAQAVDVRAWAPFGAPLEPVNINEVPLIDALAAGIPAGQEPPLYVDWRGLAEAGIEPRTPVNLRLGVHTIGQHRQPLAEAVANRPQVREAGGIRFDIHPVGEIILSNGNGYRRVSQNVNRVMAAANTDDARHALEGRLPEFRMDTIPLQDAVDFLREVTKIDIRFDWTTLPASGFTPQSPVSLRLHNVPLAFALAVLTEPIAGRPPVEWEIGDGKITARGTQR